LRKVCDIVNTAKEPDGVKTFFAWIDGKIDLICGT